MLEAYLLPPRPDDPVQLADWTMRIQKLKNNQCVNPIPASQKYPSISQPLHRNRISRNSVIGNTVQSTSSNWAGYIAFDNGGITDVKGHWGVQCLGSQQQAGAREGSWIGIGGSASSLPLTQTGTAYTKSGYKFFLEYVPNDGPYFGSGTVSCGTQIDAEVYYASSSNEWCTTVSGGNQSFSTCFSSSEQPDKTSAEWIDERPYCSNGLSKLADFNYTSYSNTYAYSPSRNWHTIGGFNNEEVTLVDGSGNTLAQPQNLDSGDTSFTDRWKATGDGVACANI